MSSVYEEYMRNVLGYEPIRYRDTYDAEYNDYMNYSNFNIPQQFEIRIIHVIIIEIHMMQNIMIT